MLLGIASLIALLGIIALSVAAYKRRFTDVRNANQGVNIIDDLLFVESNGGTGLISLYTKSISGGSGAVTVVRPISPIYYPGAVQLYVQATNDYAGIVTPGNYALNGNAILDIQTRAYRDQVLSDGNENAFGFSDSMIVRANETTGAMIYYDPAVSNFWVCYVRNASGLTQVITTVAANVANTDTYLRVISTPNSTQFFVDGNLVANISECPVTTTSMSIGWVRHKTSGSSSSSVFVDAITILQMFSTPRDFLNLPS